MTTTHHGNQFTIWHEEACTLEHTDQFHALRPDDPPFFLNVPLRAQLLAGIDHLTVLVVWNLVRVRVR